jgi:hypothetical protein
VIFLDLDVRTIITTVVIIDILQAIAIYFQYHYNRTYRGIGWWLLGSVSSAIGFILLLLRDVAPLAQISIILSNILFISALIFYSIGISLFLDRKEILRQGP